METLPLLCPLCIQLFQFIVWSFHWSLPGGSELSLLCCNLLPLQTRVFLSSIVNALSLLPCLPIPLSTSSSPPNLTDQSYQEVLSLLCSPSHWELPSLAPPTSIRPNWHSTWPSSAILISEMQTLSETGETTATGDERDIGPEARGRRTWNKC